MSDDRSLEEIMQSIQLTVIRREAALSEELGVLRLREQKARTELAEDELRHQKLNIADIERTLELPELVAGESRKS